MLFYNQRIAEKITLIHYEFQKIIEDLHAMLCKHFLVSTKFLQNRMKRQYIQNS